MPPSPPRTTPEQWAALAAVVDEGGFAAAAEALGRSQSSVSYTVQQLQNALPVPLLDYRGRRAVLTEAGATLLRRARGVLTELHGVESLAQNLAAGWETELRLAVETIFPPRLLLAALGAWSAVCRATRLELVESVLSGTTEALLRREVDLAVIHVVPPGFLGTALLPVEFVAVAHRGHALHALGRPLAAADLRAHRQVVVRDSGSRRRIDAGWLGSEERWTVSNLATSVAVLRAGLGYAWVPREHVAAELASGELVPLPLEEGATRRAELHLVHADRDSAGPATRELARVLEDACRAARGPAPG